MEEKIRLIRTDIDALSQCIDTLGITKQLLSAKDELLFAKAWMGKMLGAMGAETPYKNEGKRNLVEDIEPTAEKFGGDIILPEDLSTIGAIDWIRQQIATKVADIEKIGTEKGGRKAGVLKEQVYVHLCEARFWLGFELERIKLYNDDLAKVNGQG
jgi:hypothetical protein